jgi:hypothetical protein
MNNVLPVHVYVDSEGNALDETMGVSISSVQCVVVLDGQDFNNHLLRVHFEAYVDPDSWADAKHTPTGLQAVYDMSGNWVSGCHDYVVKPEAIQRLNVVLV